MYSQKYIGDHWLMYCPLWAQTNSEEIVDAYHVMNPNYFPETYRAGHWLYTSYSERIESPRDAVEFYKYDQIASASFLADRYTMSWQWSAHPRIGWGPSSGLPPPDGGWNVLFGDGSVLFLPTDEVTATIHFGIRDRFWKHSDQRRW